MFLGIWTQRIFVLTLLLLMFMEMEAFSSKRDIALQEIINQVKSEMTSKYKAQCFGSGGAMMTDIKMLNLSFFIKENITVDDAREIMIFFAETFLTAVNQNEKIKPHLANYPFTSENLGLMVSFLNEDGSRVIPPGLNNVILTHGEITYSVKDLENLYEHVKVYTEPYDEALSKVREGKSK